MTTAPASRRGISTDIAEELRRGPSPLGREDFLAFEQLDAIYRATCALLYNYVPTSGHPGGSISSGRMVAGLLFDALAYDFSDPDRTDADMVSYGAGHKAMGLYAMWALRDEVARIGAPELLPKEERFRLRLEDLLGFRKNPVTVTPLFRQFGARALDGHPTPATPFVRLATGASGVGVSSSVGLALGARDYHGAAAPRVHVIEGEGGLTPGRVAEALAMAGTAGLDNLTVHVDWNQASIDSDRVCREGAAPGDYVQWNPAELFALHDWNVVQVADGTDFQAVLAGQRRAAAFVNGQPTAVVYRTVKGWRYGIEGRASHGAGHKLCSAGFYAALEPIRGRVPMEFETCDSSATRCGDGAEPAVVEACLWQALGVVRRVIEDSPVMVEALAGRLREARRRLESRGAPARSGAPRIEAVWHTASEFARRTPPELALAPGTVTTLRGELGRAFEHLNRESGGALLVAAADLLGSTSVSTAARGFDAGFWHATGNPGARLVATGGICEDAMSGILAGLSTFGRHLGVGSSYGAFLAPLGHIAARLHAIGGQARRESSAEPYRPMILVCAHAGLKTGEDGPTHADPQPLQLLEGNFPAGTLITLTPWDPQEVWPLLAAALRERPAVIVPFVTRPSERVPDRERLGLAPASEALKGVYALRRAHGPSHGTVVLQESGVTYAFVEEALPLLEEAGIDLDVYYVASAELFDALPAAEQARIFPEERARAAMGITGFTLPTMRRWITSERGRAATLHPFRRGYFLGSGQAQQVLAQAGLDGRSQFEAVRSFVRGA